MEAGEGGISHNQSSAQDNIDGRKRIEGPGEATVAGHGGGRKLRCIDGINTTIYYKKKFPQ